MEEHKLIAVYKRTTDVQQTWREHGWISPSEDPKIKSKWEYFRTLHTEIDTERAFNLRGAGNER